MTYRELRALKGSDILLKDGRTVEVDGSPAAHIGEVTKVFCLTHDTPRWPVWVHPDDVAEVSHE